MLFLWLLRTTETRTQCKNSIGILFDPCEFDFVVRQTALMLKSLPCHGYLQA